MKRVRFQVSIASLAWLLAAPLANSQQLSFTPYHKSGVYDLGEKAGWTVTLPHDAPPPAGSFTYAIKKNNSDTIKTGVLDLSSGSATIETTLGEPAMLYVEVNAGGGAPAIHLGAAIAPSQLQPSVPRPADFDSFWDAKLKALGEIPIHPVLTATPTAKAGVDLFTVKLDSLGSHVQGFLATPSREGKFPALVIFQYAGVYALQPSTVVDRAAEGWLAFDVDSHDMAPDQASGVSADYPSIGNTSRETSYFLNMYLRDARAIDYITSRADWDGKTIVFMGTSMGGQQTLVTAALRPKVTAVIVNEPSGADSNGDLHGRKAGFPGWRSTDPKIMETALYFDIVNFAPRIKAPVLAAIGFIDTTTPPVGIWIAVNQIPGPKEVVPMIESDHNNRTPEKQGAFDARSREVLGILLHGGEFKPNEETARGSFK
jgi:cephalosporin-C deacetylase-like acetyl esterase